MSNPDLQELSTPRPGALVFALLFLACAAFLLSQIGSETKYSGRGSLVAQPRFWPAIGIGGMVAFGVFHVLSGWRTAQPGWLSEVGNWVRVFEFLAWFMVYVWAVPIIGYLSATILFTVLLALRMGYRRALHLWLAAGAGFAIVFVFKTLLSVKIPGGAVYEYLPGAFRNFMTVYF